MRGFALTSAVLSALLGVVLSCWLTNFVRSSNLAHAKDSAAYSMRVAVGTMDVRSAEPSTITAAQYVELTKLLRSMVGSGKYTGATAWSEAKTIAYAVEKSRIGEAEPYRPQVIEALQGRLVSTVINRTDPAIPDPTEQSSLRTYGPLLETFVPVRIGGNVAAVVQFYQRWRPVQQSIASQTLRVVLLVAGGIGLLWLGLLRIVMAASRRLTAQARENWRLATHDPLTGLPNRSLLRDRVDRALSANARSDKHLGLLLLDLDRFKDVNDTLGHDCGDVLLRQVGPRIVKQLRGGDSLARLGGDEFVVLLPEVPDLSAACEIAERIRNVLAQPFLLDPATVTVDVSIGIALAPDHGDQFDELLRQADIAMYEAKAAGGGVQFTASDQRHAGGPSLALVSQLREAVETPGQLVLHYQPTSDLMTGEVRGVEALVRWQHPSLGLIQPAEFIGLAERTGLIQPLTVTVLSGALAQVHAWNQCGLRLRIAVNISGKCLDESLPTTISRLLTENRVTPGQLVLEITESAVIGDPATADAVLKQLRQLGVTLSLDDFGTGYSSMHYLKDLPVQELKIPMHSSRPSMAGSGPGCTTTTRVVARVRAT